MFNDGEMLWVMTPFSPLFLRFITILVQVSGFELIDIKETDLYRPNVERIGHQTMDNGGKRLRVTILLFPIRLCSCYHFLAEL